MERRRRGHLKQMTAFGGAKEAKPEQTELCRDLGAGWIGGGPRHVTEKRAQGCMFRYKAIRVRANTLEPSVLWRGTELCLRL